MNDFILDHIHSLESELDAQTPDINLPLTISMLYYLRGQTMEMRERLTKIYELCQDGGRPLSDVLEVLKFAEQYEVDRHAEKQGISYSDAWNYFEDQGYDMSLVWDQSSGPDPEGL